MPFENRSWQQAKWYAGFFNNQLTHRMLGFSSSYPEPDVLGVFCHDIEVVNTQAISDPTPKTPRIVKVSLNNA
jgi:hypothetical protein